MMMTGQFTGESNELSEFFGAFMYMAESKGYAVKYQIYNTLVEGWDTIKFSLRKEEGAA